MDCAKAVAARIAKPNQSLAQMKGILKVHKKLPLLIAIPTTAGTGSETTLAAVITDAETRYKYADVYKRQALLLQSCLRMQEVSSSLYGFRRQL